MEAKRVASAQMAWGNSSVPATPQPVQKQVCVHVLALALDVCIHTPPVALQEFAHEFFVCLCGCLEKSRIIRPRLPGISLWFLHRS